MLLAVTLACALSPQQLDVTPVPGAVGEPCAVLAQRVHHVGYVPGDEVLPETRRAAPIPGLPVVVETPDGAVRPLPPTDPNGRTSFVPELAGRHVFRCEVDGVVVLAPIEVVAPTRRWWLTLPCIPLGLALLWRNLRRHGAPR